MKRPTNTGVGVGEKNNVGFTSKSQSMDLSEFLSSVADHSCSSADLNSRPSPSTAWRQFSYKSRVFKRAFRTSLKKRSVEETVTP